LIEQANRIFFQYDEAWLDTGLNLSPFRLPFARELFEHQDRAFGPLPGVFDDALPDGWGLLLMDRHFRRLGREPSTLSPLERLCWLGTRTMGALTFHPPEAGPAPEGAFDLDDLARQAQELLSGRSSEVLPQLLRAGGSPGGARPKVLVGFKEADDLLCQGADDLPAGFSPWLVKFPAHGEGQETGAAEYAYALMARAAGLDVPATRLFETPGGARFFGIERFDRARGRRFHVHTFGNLIHADFRVPSCDYSDLLKVAALLTRDQGQVARTFRRMVFNVLAHNRDDHAKNFAFILDDARGEWSLAPAYDLTFSPGPGGEHTMTVAGEGRAPGREHLLRVAGAFQVAPAEAGAIIEEVRHAVASWPRFAEEAKVPKARAREIASKLST
jgi:serine/threonine-protein kinase HipA